MLRRCISVLISIIILLSVFSSVPFVSAEAEQIQQFYENTDEKNVELSTDQPSEYTFEKNSTADTVKTEVSLDENSIDVQTSVAPERSGSSGMGIHENEEYESRCLPNYINGGQVMYNRYTADMLMEMSKGAYYLNNEDPSWKNELNSRFGYTQFFHLIDEGLYDLGEYDKDESYYDENGEEQIRQVTEKKFMSACNATVAFKEVTFRGETRYAIAVAFKGTNFKIDFADIWNDIRFLCNEDGLANGFADNAEAFYRSCKKIKFTVGNQSVSLYNMIQDMKNPDSPYCMLVTGHSLGAALADVFVGHYLYEDGVDPRNVVAYTFAAPLSSCYPRERNNIINFINAEDPVPYLGFSWIGSSYHIGTDIVYYPDDEFRENYGDGLLKEHSKDNVYTPLTRLMSSEINGEAFIDSYYPYHTNCNVSVPFASFDKRSVHEFYGNLTVSDSTYFDEASVTVNGNCDVGGLNMEHDTDYLLVKGDFSVVYGNNDYHPSPSLLSGTVELKGDFYQKGGSGYAYCESRFFDDEGVEHPHKTIFSGSGTQKITFDAPWSYNRFYNLVLENTDINFATPVYMDYVDLGITQDLTLPHTEKLEVIGSMGMNGYSLLFEGDIECNELYDVHHLSCQDYAGIATVGGLINCRDISGSVNASEGINCRDINGNVSVEGGLNCRNMTGHQLSIKNCTGYVSGNLNVDSSTYFEEASLTVNGNCDVGGLNMEHDTDYLLVKGDFSVVYGNNDYYPSPSLLAGTVELKGDFYQKDGSAYTYCELYYYDDEGVEHPHRTIFSGNGTQKITFDNPWSYNRFYNLVLENTDINFATPIYLDNVELGITQDLTLPHTEKLEVIGGMGMNGYSLLFDGDIECNELYDVHHLSCQDFTGNATVSGSFNCRDINGNVTALGGLNCRNMTGHQLSIKNCTGYVSSNLNLDSSTYFEEASLTVNGNCDIGGLNMEHDTDYLLVKGDFSVVYGNNDYYPSPSLLAGTVELKGDFYQKDGSAYTYCELYYYDDEGVEHPHRTIFSGNGTQKITFDNPWSYNRFYNLVLENQSEDGVLFASEVNVSNLFDHNQNKFKLYQNGEGSNFNDYDGDNVKDHQDYYPKDPNRYMPDSVILGDADGDGEVTILDATAIQKRIAVLDTGSFNEDLADADRDGNVTILDTTAIQKWLALLPAPEGIGKPV